MNYFQYNILSRGFICFVIYHSRMNEMTWEKYRHRMIAIITRRNALGLKNSFSEAEENLSWFTWYSYECLCGCLIINLNVLWRICYLHSLNNHVKVSRMNNTSSFHASVKKSRHEYLISNWVSSNYFSII